MAISNEPWALNTPNLSNSSRTTNAAPATVRRGAAHHAADNDILVFLWSRRTCRSGYRATFAPFPPRLPHKRRSINVGGLWTLQGYFHISQAYKFHLNRRFQTGRSLPVIQTSLRDSRSWHRFRLTKNSHSLSNPTSTSFPRQRLHTLFLLPVRKLTIREASNNGDRCKFNYFWSRGRRAYHTWSTQGQPATSCRKGMFLRSWGFFWPMNYLLKHVFGL